MLKPSDGKQSNRSRTVSAASTAAPTSPTIGCDNNTANGFYTDTMIDDEDSIMLLFGSHGKRTTTTTEKVRFTDGSSWLVTRGSHPAVSVVVEKLEEVKRLFNRLHPDEPLGKTLQSTAKAGPCMLRSVPRGRHAYGCAQFSQATRFERKQRKQDWLLSRGRDPLLDRPSTDADDAFMSSFTPTGRYNTEPTNGAGRRMRRSMRYQDALGRQRTARTYERRNRTYDRALRKDRWLHMLTHGDVA